MPQASFRQLPDWLQGEGLTHFITGLQPAIEQIARNLYYRVRVSVALDDLVQEGHIAAWQAAQRYDAAKIKDESSFTGYCMLRARGAMLNYLDMLHKSSAISLDEYLQSETSDGSTMQRDIADTPQPHRRASRAQRHMVLTALRTLTCKERLVIMAHYRIDSSNGYSPTPDDIQRDLHLSKQAYYGTRTRGLRKLALAF
jgi:RNA polymerase sigma factor (sigma-70 family)